MVTSSAQFASSIPFASPGRTPEEILRALAS